jgi:hypothetical protein
MVLGDLGIDRFAAMGFEPRQRAFLVRAHQPAVARDIGRKDRGQPALDPPAFHGARSRHLLRHIGIEIATYHQRQHKSEGAGDRGVNSRSFPG